MKLSICIPTLDGREPNFNRLITHLWHPDVQIISLRDNKEMSIGAKRQLLLESVTTEYFVMIDDDDSVCDGYINQLLPLLIGVDCITYQERVLLNGHAYRCNHSLKYKVWADKTDGFDFVRTPFYKDVLRTDIAKKVGFKDMRFGEDHDFAKRILPHLKTETHIDKEMYFYHGKILTPKEHAERYGITHRP